MKTNKWMIAMTAAALITAGTIGTASARGYNNEHQGQPGGYHQEQQYYHRDNGPGSHRPDPYYQLRMDARETIHRTAAVLMDARQAAEYGHRYQTLNLAVAHQEEAKRLYRNGFYRDAINHSLRARDLAFGAIRENRRHPRPDYYRNSMENQYGQSSPRNQDLDLKINWSGRDANGNLWRVILNFDL